MTGVQDSWQLLPLLSDINDNSFLCDYLAANKYLKVTNAWLLSQASAGNDTPKKRFLSLQTDLHTNEKRERRRKGKNLKCIGGPTALWAILEIHTVFQSSCIQEAFTGADIGLSSLKKVKVVLKQLQCWDSSPKYALLGVNNRLNPVGVELTLSRHLKLIKKKLCQMVHVNMEEYCDLDMPQMKTTPTRLQELLVPDDERKQLAFESFSSHCCLFST